jgi:hypothetical protein
MAGKKTFVAGEVLTAQDVNDYLMDQSVMNFATSAARSSAIPTPTDGMVTYRQDIDALEVYNGAAYVPVNKSVVSYLFDTTASLVLTGTTETLFMTAPSFTPIAGRLYEVTVTVGVIQKTTAAGQVTVGLRQNTVAGTRLDVAAYTSQPVGSVWSHTKTIVLTSAQMGTTAFVPIATIQSSNNGVTAYNTGGFGGSMLIKDIGLA